MLGIIGGTRFNERVSIIRSVEFARKYQYVLSMYSLHRYLKQNGIDSTVPATDAECTSNFTAPIFYRLKQK